ncbi:hypothetical protein AVEN_136050-1 [Araneus ventricosus]|uniref:Uncharacterized protein n=1 Tax=Araneus ventricosus TaxID=182803 RepID=A0A4Y2BQ64_ARAVE|nr:hypothetical protein AVEN_101410-1 [Araneus ventricosus]GBL93416.1 hypothetical protein AVEN_136050-1 [Araneus ventricosus]
MNFNTEKLCKNVVALVTITTLTVPAAEAPFNDRPERSVRSKPAADTLVSHISPFYVWFSSGIGISRGFGAGGSMVRNPIPLKTNGVCGPVAR